MLLAIDARNENVSLGVRSWDGGSWALRFTVAAVERSVDEWESLTRSFLTSGGVAAESLDCAIIASVVPRLSPRLMKATRALLSSGGELLLVGPGIKTGISIHTDNPSELGADLIANAVAAKHIAQPPLLVVDFGAALTITALDASGALVGAAIAPGLEAAAALLRDRAALLPEVLIQKPIKAVGKNSAEAIRSGLVLGWEGLLGRLLDRMGAELEVPGHAIAVVGTGGDEAPIDLVRGWTSWAPSLTMDGLFLIAEKNRV